MQWHHTSALKINFWWHLKLNCNTYGPSIMTAYVCVHEKYSQLLRSLKQPQRLVDQGPEEREWLALLSGRGGLGSGLFWFAKGTGIPVATASSKLKKCGCGGADDVACDGSFWNSLEIEGYISLRRVRKGKGMPHSWF